jgi:hypothetical protein
LWGGVIFTNSLITDNNLNYGYIAPFSFFVVLFGLRITSKNININFIYKSIVCSIFIYFFVGLAQYVIDENFLTQVVGGNKSGLLSNGGGRGTISLASEPSYYGFQIIILLAIIFKIKSKNYILILLCGAFQVLFLAKSSTALLVLIVALLFLVLLINFSTYKLFLSVLILLFLTIFLINFFPKDSRIYELFGALLVEDLGYFIHVDQSTSERFVHAVYPFVCTVQNYGFPSGVFGPLWYQCLNNIDVIWFQDLTDNVRVMSGIGEILLYYGLFSYPFVWLFVSKISNNNTTDLNRYFSISVILLLLATFTFSNPSVALCYFVYSKINSQINKVVKS